MNQQANIFLPVTRYDGGDGLYGCRLDQSMEIAYRALLSERGEEPQPISADKLVRSVDAVFEGEGAPHGYTVDALSSMLIGENTIWVRDDRFHSWLPFDLSPQVADAVRRTEVGRPLQGSFTRVDLALLQIAGVLRDGDRSSTDDERYEEAKGVYAAKSPLNLLHCVSLRTYLRRKSRLGQVIYNRSDDSGRLHIHNDGVTRFYLQWALPLAKRIYEIDLKASYTFVIYYKRGDSLRLHTDRDQCEYSLGLSVDYLPMANGLIPWPLQFIVDQQAVRLNSSLGDVVGFRGRQVSHLRSPFLYGDLCTVMMLHYVDPSFQGSLD